MDQKGKELMNELKSKFFPMTAIATQIPTQISWQKQEIMGKGNLPKRHFDKLFVMDVNHQWNKYYTLLKSKLGTGMLFSLIGNRGVGKTQIAVELAKFAVVEHDSSIFYTTAFEFFIEIRNAYNQKSEKSATEILKIYKKPKLLLIDEIHERSDSEFENRILTHVIDSRYADMRDTVLMGNLKANELAAKLGPSISSRLLEAGGILDCEWESFRK